MSTEEAELRLAWRRTVGDDGAATERFDALVARHREPHRRYHTLRHVAWVVRHVEDLHVAAPVDDLHAVVVAACYHDAVYEPARADNETVSARLASRDLRGLGWPADRAASVAAMVEATAHLADRAEPAPDHDTAVLLDADLAVFGAPPAAYQAYATGVRAEYAHVDDEAWRTGRAAVLVRFLDRPTIFVTDAGRERWEARARANLGAELAELRRG
jgi:predicted metal-dependent HD superfamily phosphohydrolase